VENSGPDDSDAEDSGLDDTDAEDTVAEDSDIDVGMKKSERHSPALSFNAATLFKDFGHDYPGL
jgi:hypothetical protein